MNRLRLVLLILLSCIATQGFSCSGAGVDLIWENVAFGRTSFMICLVVGIITIAVQLFFRLFKTRLTIVVLILTVLMLIYHPHRWLDGMEGDCGYTLGRFSIYALVGHAVLLIVTIVIARKHIVARKVE